MAPTDFTLPSDMTLTGALALCLFIVVAIATVTAMIVVVGWAFTRLSPSRRNDIIRALRAARRR